MTDFRLEITRGENSLTFGPRYPGQIGKDIIAIKVALGVISLDSPSAPNDQPPEPAPRQSAEIPLDNRQWFDCVSSKGIDLTQAATFDTHTKNAIMNYQINNQFLILCYLFDKYGVSNIKRDFVEVNYISIVEAEKYSSSILRQLESIRILFDSEFGTLGEATLAVMHGWVPHTTVSNRSYLHSREVYSDNAPPTSVVPEVLLSDFEHGRFGQSWQDLVDAGLTIPGSLLYNDPIRLENFFNLGATNIINWLLDVDSDIRTQYCPHGSIDYIPRFSGSSMLYHASIQVFDNSPKGNDASMLPPEQRKERLRKMFYPDPFTDPPPFFISENEIGFFDTTEFVLSPTGPLPSDQSDIIKELEEIALQKVLKFYSKPQIWNHSPTDRQFSLAYFSGAEMFRYPSHNAYYPRTITEEMLGKSSSYRQNQEKIKILQDSIERLTALKNPSPRHRQRRFDHIEGVNSYDEYLEYLSEQIREKKRLIAELTMSLSTESVDLNTKKKYWVLSTDNIIDSLTSDDNPAGRSQDSVQHWRTIEGLGQTEPLIKFIEYRTPSLRPTENYRSFFILNRKKLDAISTGDDLQDIQAEATLADPPPDPREACPDYGSEQSIRVWEEYKTHARRKRREMVRKFRTQLSEHDIFHQPPDIDLGIYGPFDLNKAFSAIYGLSNVSSDYEYTSKAIETMVTGIDSLTETFNLQNTDSEQLQVLLDHNNSLGTNTKDGKKADVRASKNHNVLKVSIADLKGHIKIATKDLKEADQIINEGGIKFAPGSKFIASREAQELKSFESEMLEFLSSLDFDLDLKSSITSSEDQEDVILVIQFAIENPGSPPLGPFVGKSITRIHVEHKGTGHPAFSGDAEAFKKYESLNRPRTVNYISNIKKMAPKYPGGAPGGFGDKMGAFLGSFFDDKRGACKDLGIDTNKSHAIALVGTYTSGLKVESKDQESMGKIIKDWAKNHYKDPALTWAEASANNANASMEDTFDEDEALRAFGKLCTIEQVYNEFLDKIDIASLICDYLKCVKLPGFDLKLPSFHLPPLPRVPIIGWYMYLVEFLKDNIKEVLIRILCTFVRTIIDKLAFPFCDEQLKDFIAAGSSASPLANEALIKALTDTGVSSGNQEAAKNFFEDASTIMTGQELCYLLTGKQLDNAGMRMLQRLALKNGIDTDLNTSESIANFFGVLGAYIPDDLCSELTKLELPRASSCKETADIISAIRNRIQTNDTSLTEEEIEAAIQLAKKNLEDQKETLEALSGASVSLMIPNNLLSGNSLLGSNMPSVLSDEMEKTTDNIFEMAKSAYMSGLSSFIPNTLVLTPDSPVAGDEDYDDLETLTLQSCIQRLSNYTRSMKRAQSRSPNSLSPLTFASFCQLYDIFQVEKVRGHWVHRYYKTSASTAKILNPESVLYDEYIALSRNPLSQDPSTDLELIPVPYVGGLGASRDFIDEGLFIWPSYPNGNNLEQAYVSSYAKFNRGLFNNRLLSLDQQPYDQVINNSDNYLYNASPNRRDSFTELMSPTATPWCDFVRCKDVHFILADSRNWPECWGIPPIRLGDAHFGGTVTAEGQILQREQTKFYKMLCRVAKSEFPSTVDPDTGQDNSAWGRANKRPNDSPLQVRHDSPIGGGGYPQQPGGCFFELLEGTAILQEMAMNRITELTTIINDILSNKAQTNSENYLPEIKEIISNAESLTRNNIFLQILEDGETIEVSQDTTLSVSAGPYQPTITFREIGADMDKDRFDVQIERDYFLGQGQEDSVTFRFCESLPEGLKAYVDPNARQGLGKRQAFGNLMSEIYQQLPASYQAGVIPQELSNQVASVYETEIFEKTTMGILKKIREKLSESQMFSYDMYGSELDKRVSGDPIISLTGDCMFNRYAMTDSSILSFEDVIISDASSEIISELSKPENSLFNRDFDDLGPFEKALQNISILAFVRTCLVDMMLKGSIANSTWSFTTISSDPIILRYATEHVRRELNQRETLSQIWSQLIERVSGISNTTAGLEKVVQTELQKIAERALRVYHPSNTTTDFDNWPIANVIPIVHPRTPPEVANTISYRGADFNLDDSPVNAGFHVLNNQGSPVPPGSSTLLMEEYVRISPGALDSLIRGSIPDSRFDWRMSEVDQILEDAGEPTQLYPPGYEFNESPKYQIIKFLMSKLIGPLSRYGERTLYPDQFRPAELSDQQFLSWKDAQSEMYYRTIETLFSFIPDDGTGAVIEFSEVRRYLNPRARSREDNLDDLPEEQLFVEGSEPFYLDRDHRERRAIEDAHRHLFDLVGNDNWRMLVVDFQERQRIRAIEPRLNGTPITELLLAKRQNRPPVQGPGGLPSLMSPDAFNDLLRRARSLFTDENYLEIISGLDAIYGVRLISVSVTENESPTPGPEDPEDESTIRRWVWNTLLSRRQDPDINTQSLESGIYRRIRHAERDCVRSNVLSRSQQNDGHSPQARRRLCTERLRPGEVQALFVFYAGELAMEAPNFEIAYTDFLDEPEESLSRYERFLKNSWEIPDSNTVANEHGIMNIYAHTDTQNVSQGISIPIALSERSLDFESCPGMYLNSPVGMDVSSFRHRALTSLLQNKKVSWLVESIFPIKRFMTLYHLHSTSILAGFGDIPGIMNPAKASIGLVSLMAANPPSLQGQMDVLSVTDFKKMMNNKFPGDPDDASCFDFPGGFKEMLEKFYEELKELIKQMPSIIFRGVANQLDPAYKEMRTHFFNCDIQDLTWRGVKPNSADSALVNGLYKPGITDGDDEAKAEWAERQADGTGKYLPIMPGLPLDMLQTQFGNPFQFPERALKTTLKTVAYAYSGMLPFIDLSTLFKVPCIDLDEAFLKDGKYDAGYYGRYGHPLTPFTMMALSTPHLKNDLERRASNCRPLPVNDCEDVD